MPAFHRRSLHLAAAPAMPIAAAAAAASALALALALALATPASAQESKPFTCSASALSGTILGQPIAPVTANPGAACATTKAGLAEVLPAPLKTSAVGASTVLTGPANRRDLQSAVAFGGVADLSVSALPELPIQLPIEEILALVPEIRIPLGIPLLPPEIVIDVKPAVAALLPDGKLPRVDLLNLKALSAYAGAACKDGKPVMAGTSQVAGLSLLGQELPLNALAEQVLSLLDTTAIDLGKIDLSKVVLPLGLDILDPLLGPLLQAAIQPVLDAIPPIPIPAQLAKVKVTPGEQVRTADTLTQRALRIEASLLGISLVDLSVGEATVGTAGVDCSPPPAQEVQQDATAKQLECTTRKLVLVDVLERNGKVLLTGRADTKLAGQTVDIIFEADGKKAATARVLPNGSFAATAPLPARHLREGNRARYRAQLGNERSDNLKLRRRMVVESMVARAGKVTISGRVMPPLGKPTETIRIQQRLSCTKNIDVARIKPSSSGRFKVTVDAPKSEQAAVYRVITKVPPTKRSKKRFSTFTLPRAIDLG